MVLEFTDGRTVKLTTVVPGVGEGSGNFEGLTQKLDYLQDLGVTAIWLLPFYPSPLRDDGYDIADYTSVHPDYGDIDSFKKFLDAAHLRDLSVITEVFVNILRGTHHPRISYPKESPATQDVSTVPNKR